MLTAKVPDAYRSVNANEEAVLDGAFPLRILHSHFSLAS